MGVGVVGRVGREGVGMVVRCSWSGGRSSALRRVLREAKGETEREREGGREGEGW